MKLTLTREQRAAFFAGNWPQIRGEGTCPVEVGHVHRLSSLLRIEVTMIRKPKRGGWRLEYDVYDQRADRDVYLMPAARSLRVAEDGLPAFANVGDELGYGSNPRDSIDAGVVPVSYKNVLRMTARSKDAARRLAERSEDERRKQERAVRERLRDALQNLTPTAQIELLAAIEREIESAQIKRAA